MLAALLPALVARGELRGADRQGPAIRLGRGSDVRPADEPIRPRPSEGCAQGAGPATHRHRRPAVSHSAGCPTTSSRSDYESYLTNFAFANGVRDEGHLKDYQDDAVRDVLVNMRKARKRWKETGERHAFSLTADWCRQDGDGGGRVQALFHAMTSSSTGIPGPWSSGSAMTPRSTSRHAFA